MQKYGLLGRKLGHSYSKIIHKALGDYEYEMYEKEPDELEAFLSDKSISGLNVTIPYKKTVIPYCAELSPLAQKLGNVNTLVRRADGRWYGDNTDAYGLKKTITHRGIDPMGRKALVLGSGGASATAVAVLKDMGCREVVVISRSGENNYNNLHLNADAEIIVNATPVGMFPNNGEKPLSLEHFPSLEGVVDVIYNPVRTQLLMDAEKRNIPCCSGLYMLVCQALRSAELFTGKKISEEKVDEIYRSIAFSMKNLILIGMPGCGKSSIARALGKALSRPMLDADEVFEKKAGMSIPEFFAKYGEEEFRKQETEVLQEICKLSGHIIATGGGCVTRKENYDILHQNGKIIYICRGISDLTTRGRPLSQRDGVQKLYEERKALYESFADLTVDNRQSVRQTTDYILEVLKK